MHYETTFLSKKRDIERYRKDIENPNVQQEELDKAVLMIFH